MNFHWNIDGIVSDIRQHNADLVPNNHDNLLHKKPGELCYSEKDTFNDFNKLSYLNSSANFYPPLVSRPIDFIFLENFSISLYIFARFF